MEAFEEFGGSDKFVETMAESIGVNEKYIEVTSLEEGSVIVNYDLITDKNSDKTLDEIKKLQEEALKSGKVNLGGNLLSFKSGEDEEVKVYVPPAAKVEPAGESNVLTILLLIFVGIIVVMIVAIIWLKKKKDAL